MLFTPPSLSHSPHTTHNTTQQLMRGAGCTINDLWDRDIDRQVERTRSRPLAAGTVTPLAALLFLGAQLSASLAILLQLNTYTQVQGCGVVCLGGLLETV